MTTNHPAHGPVSLDRLHQIREILSKALAQSDGGNLGYAMTDAVKVIDGAIAAFGAEPVLYAAYETLAYAKAGELHLKCLSQPMGDAVIPLYAHRQATEEIGSWNNHRNTPTNKPAIDTYDLLKHIEGMEVSVDVSTCDADAGHRYFGTVTEISELDTAKNGYILLVQDAKPNFKQAGNSPVIGFDLASEPDRSVEVHYLAPPGYVMVPKKLTAENGAKGVLSGEFSETKFINCPECFGDDECETCDGSGQIEITVPVSWTNIKAIWAKGVEHFEAAPQQENV
ncbi:hypothetical protein [Citrobacter sp. CF971]|uniref:hypothetical protein n=1 Tax=Citrobacter sp. CF971 TaxID=2566012 RepID=UPI001FEED1BA|nr:hypothetical protein [Citrobacter sp. CF971]